MDEKQFLETWQIHNRINLYLLDAVEPAALSSLSASKGRNVGELLSSVISFLTNLIIVAK